MRLAISSPRINDILVYKAIFRDHKINVLITYASKVDKEAFQETYRDEIGCLMLDSGAYTLNKSQWTRQMFDIAKKYGHFASTAASCYDLKFNLDEDFSIHGREANLRNQLYLERHGVDAIPVVHDLFRGEIEYYISQGYKIVAIGQCEEGRAFDQLESGIWRLHSKGVLVHLFGNTNYNYLAGMPVWSSDSSSWSRYIKYGNVMWWNNQKEPTTKNPGYDRLYFPKDNSQPNPKRGNFYLTYNHRKEFEEYLGNTLNIEIGHLLGVNRVQYRNLLNIVFFTEMERRITAAHAKNGWSFKC